MAGHFVPLAAFLMEPEQHLAAIRKLFDYLTTGGILDSNPVIRTWDGGVEGIRGRDHRDIDRL